LLLLLLLYTINYSISTSKNLNSSLSNDFLYVVYTTDFPLDCLHSPVIRTPFPPYNPDYLGASVDDAVCREQIFFIMVRLGETT